MLLVMLLLLLLCYPNGQLHFHRPLGEVKGYCAMRPIMLKITTIAKNPNVTNYEKEETVSVPPDLAHRGHFPEDFKNPSIKPPKKVR